MRNSDSAIAKLVEGHFTKLATYARHLGADEAFAKDAANEAFLRLCKKESISFENAKAWLYKVCRNYVLDELKRRSRELCCDESLANSFTDFALRADEQCAKDDDARLILDEVKKLNPVQRELVFMRFYNGLEYAQMAQIMDMSISNVGVNISRGVAQIRRNLELVYGKK